MLESGTVFAVDSTSGKIYHNKGRTRPKLAGINDESWCGFSIPIFIRDNTLCIFTVTQADRGAWLFTEKQAMPPGSPG
ncbi:hypothetical protein GCM10027347_22190 [Larkinella harenae]